MVQWGTCCIAFKASSNGQHIAQMSVVQVLSPTRPCVLASCSTHWCSWWILSLVSLLADAVRARCKPPTLVGNKPVLAIVQLKELSKTLSCRAIFPSVYYRKALALWLVCVLLNSFVSVTKVPEFVLSQFQWVLTQWQQQRNFLLWKISRAPGNTHREAVLTPCRLWNCLGTIRLRLFLIKCKK